MKRILMICNYFAPYNEIAAVRITKLAKYMKKSGWEVFVLCERRENEIQDEILKKDARGVHILRVENSVKMSKLLQQYRKRIKRIRDKKYNDLDRRTKFNRDSGNYEFYPFETAHPMLGSLDYYMELLRQYDLFHEAKGLLKKHGEFDCCLSSYGDYFGLLAGCYYKKCHPDIRWIFDVRDPVCRYKFTPKYAWPTAAFLERRACVQADAVTAVTFHLGALYKRKYNENTFCITNGFDRDDRKGLTAARLSREKLCFAYTGSMYGGLQDFSVFFECIRELADKKQINTDRIEFHFAGRETAFPIFCRQAQKYGLGKQCVNHGRLPRKEALRLQMRADILLLCLWDYKAGLVGNITGKLLEYMTAERPVLTIMNGDRKDNDVTRIIRKCGLGIVYEQARHVRDKKELLQYIQKAYEEFDRKGSVSFQSDYGKLASFDYRLLTRRLLGILEGDRN